ncbi:hypothetical protein ACWAUC_18885 [Bradyrhizobium guangdongense]
MMDKNTKLLGAAIAFGLLANAAAVGYGLHEIGKRPVVRNDQGFIYLGDKLEEIATHLSSIADQERFKRCADPNVSRIGC